MKSQLLIGLVTGLTFLYLSIPLRAQEEEAHPVSENQNEELSPLFIGLVTDIGTSLESGGPAHYNFGTRFGNVLIPVTRSADGTPFSVGLTLTHDPGTGSRRVGFSLGVSRSSGTYEHHYHAVVNASYDTGVAIMQTDFTILNLGLTPSQSLFSIGTTEITLSAGLIVQHLLSATETRSFTWQQGGGDSIPLINELFPTSDEKQAITDIRSILLSVQLGLGPDIWITPNMRVSPSFFLRITTGSIAKGSEWQLGSLGGGFEAVWRL